MTMTGAMRHIEAPAGDRQAFLDAMAAIAMTVNIVTTDGPAGCDGMTVTAMSSVSADGPHPILLVCIKAESRPAPLLLGNGVFCVNVLREEQASLADAFAGRLAGSNDDWFSRAHWSPLRTGAPALDAAVVNFDCRIAEITSIGTHHVVFGEVLAIRRSIGRPLLHSNRRYLGLGAEPIPSSRQPSGNPGNSQ
jgi:flavin reductase